MLHTIPVEIALYIFSFLDEEAIVKRISLVCKAWLVLTEADLVWRVLYARRWPAESLPTRNAEGALGTADFLATLNMPLAIKHTEHAATEIGFRDLYRRRRILDNRWLSAKYSRIEFTAHTQALNAVKFSSTAVTPRLVTCADDKRILVWTPRKAPSQDDVERPSKPTKLKKKSLSSGGAEDGSQYFELERALGDKHTHVIWALGFDGRIIVSGSYDENLILWSADTGEVLHIFEHVHNAGIEELSFTNNWVATCGGRDATVKLFDASATKLVHTFQGHKFRVFTVSAGCHGNDPTTGYPTSGTIVSASADQSFRVWDPRSGQCVACVSTNVTACWFETVRLRGHYVATGDREGTVSLWDLRHICGPSVSTSTSAPAPVETMRLHNALSVRDIFFDDVKVVGANEYGVHLWMRAKEGKKRGEVHVADVNRLWCMEADERALICGDCEGKVTILDFGGVVGGSSTGSSKGKKCVVQ